LHFRLAATITTKTAKVFKKNTYQDTNQTSCQSVQTTNVNINATDGISLAFTVLQQSKADLSGGLTEERRLLS
jgi:hypothetical protein